MFRLIAQFFAFKVFKFSLKGSFPKDKKYVIAVVPHTSNWDFVIAIESHLSKGTHTFCGKERIVYSINLMVF